jgi:hypothetical protein
LSDDATKQDFEAFIEAREKDRSRLEAQRRARRLAFLEKPITEIVIGRSPYIRAALVEAGQTDFGEYVAKSIGRVPRMLTGATISLASLTLMGWGMTVNAPHELAPALFLAGTFGGLAGAGIAFGAPDESYREITKKIRDAAEFMEHAGRDPHAVLAEAAAAGTGLEDRLKAFLGGSTPEEMRAPPRLRDRKSVDTQKKAKIDALRALRGNPDDPVPPLKT